MVNYRSEGFEMPENEPPESETAPPSSIDSRKATVVALFAAAPSAALVFWWLLYLAANFDAPVVWARWASLLAFGVIIPLYFPFKVWLRPTLKNLRLLPFVATGWGAFWGAVIYRRLSGWLELENLHLMIFPLATYFLVKKVMVWWLEMPELKDSGLSIGTKRGLWWLYCFFLWSILFDLSNSELLIEAFGYDEFSMLTTIAQIFVPIALAVICYYVGKRALNLNQK